MDLNTFWQKFDWKKIFLPVFASLILANVLILDWVVFKPTVPLLSPGAPALMEKVDVKPTPVVEADFCPLACLTAIGEATTDLVSVPPVSQVIRTEPRAKELYIPLGGGSTQSTSWVEMMGIESVIDMANYPNVKSIVFEATMRIPTANGRVYAKLYNVTDKHDAWYSEVYAEGNQGYRAEAKGVILASGRKLYRVKMKTTMGFESILDSARIKILLE